MAQPRMVHLDKGGAIVTPECIVRYVSVGRRGKIKLLIETRDESSEFVIEDFREGVAYLAKRGRCGLG